jgi:NAD(P)-dependent dehydrogenase (short-subunit alcohol dehydrogenase family)
MTLIGDTCVVTGASSGIGRALVLRLAADAARVWAVGRNEAELRALVGEAEPGRVEPIVADLERHDGIDALVNRILGAGEAIDLLAHAAGALALGPVDGISPADVERQCRVNLVAPILLTQRLLPALKERQGQIVFVNSLAAHRGDPNNAVYAATKAGLKTFADGLRAQVNADGMRVITVHVGRTATPLQVSMHGIEGREYRPELLLQPDDVVGVVLMALTLPPNGELTDINLRPMAKLPAL